MTDQDPTQAYQPPAAPEPAAAPPPPPSAVPAPPAPPAAPTSAPAAPSATGSDGAPATGSYDAAPAPGAYGAAPATSSLDAAPVPSYAAGSYGAPAAGAYGTAPAGDPYAVAPGAVATEPVAATQAPRPGRSRVRWIVAALVTLLVAGTAAGATLLLTGKSGDPAVLAWAPADTLMYAEGRLDLPGDQAAELAKLMKAFPGFEDQAAFSTKVSEALDQLVGKASDGRMSYKADIEPWFNGQAAVALRAVPAADDPAAARIALLAGTKDAKLAAAWAKKLLDDAGSDVTSSTVDYGGVTITVIEPTTSSDKMQLGYAVVGPVLVTGDLESVKATIDTQGKQGLPANAKFKEASASITGDRLGFAYMDYSKLFDAMKAIAGSAAPSFAMPQSVLDMLPSWVVEVARADDSGFVVDVVAPHTDQGMTAGESKLPALLPKTTVALVDGHDVGAMIKRMHDLYADMDATRDAVKQLDDALGLVGGLDAATGWIGESAFIVTRDGDKVAGGIAIVPTDKADAERLMNQLKTFVQLGGAQAGISITEEDHNGVTINVVDLSQLAPLAGSMAGGVPLPSDIKLAWAMTDNIVVLGYGTDFVKSVLDAPSAGSLAADPRFADALKRVDAKHTGLVWVDVAAIRDAVEGVIPADKKATYERDVKPYLDAFDYFIETGTVGDKYDTGRFVLHVAGD